MKTPPTTGALPLCPSAQPDWQGSVLIGVVGGSAEEPRLVPISEPQPVTDSLLALAAPVTPTEVFRFAAPCLCSGCQHYQESQCRLATRIVQRLPLLDEPLPTCGIRAQCRWWLQEGRAACLRCPQVVTDNYSPSEEMRLAAHPGTPAHAG